MKTVSVTLSEVAQELANGFETNSVGHVYFTGSYDGWKWEAVCEAACDGMKEASKAADILVEWCEDNPDAESFEGSELSERIDSAISVYYAEQKTWFATNGKADEFCEQVLSEGLVDPSADDFNMYKVLACGMYLQLESIVQTFANAIESQLAEITANNESE